MVVKSAHNVLHVAVVANVEFRQFLKIALVVLVETVRNLDVVVFRNAVFGAQTSRVVAIAVGQKRVEEPLSEEISGSCRYLQSVARL